MKFHIVVTGFNCKAYVKNCLASISRQTYDNFDVTIIDDASTDKTYENILRYKKQWWGLIRNSTNMGAAYNRLQAIKNLDDETAVLLLGLDDELTSDCLATIKKEYDNGKWMTYGNWINQNGVGLPSDFNLYFDDQTHAERSYRTVKYRSTSPNTFYAKLFKRIPEADFTLNGKWIDTTTESEVMFSCLEMCGKDRIGVIEKPIYIYNQNLPGGTQRRLGQGYKNQVYSEIIKRPKRNLYEGA